MAGAVGEEMTAELLEPLGGEGWGGFYDRALPTGRANFDHVLIPPGAGLVVLVDSKLWSRKRGEVRRTAGGQLRHGGEDREGAVESLRYETRVLSEQLGRAGAGVKVVPVIAVHSAPVSGGRFMLDGSITVIEAAGLLGLLRSWAGEPNPRAFKRLAAAADSVLPRYGQGGAR